MSAHVHAYVNMKHAAHITGWRRLIGSLKLQIIFHKGATKYRSLLRKMTYKDKVSYESSPPCNIHVYIWIHIHMYIYIYIYIYVFNPKLERLTPKA